MVHPCHSTDIDTDWKKSNFILLEGSDFHMIDYLSITFHTFTRRMLISISVDEMLLPRYGIWFTNLRCFPLRVEIVPFLFKSHEICFICIHIEANVSHCLL